MSSSTKTKAENLKDFDKNFSFNINIVSEPIFVKIHVAKAFLSIAPVPENTN